MMWSELISIKFLILYIFILSACYVHFRGKVRHKFFRQLFDHSTLMAPVNAVMYLCSPVPAKPYLSVEDFPELKVLRENWQVFREEALALADQGYIKASDKYDDAGFNSFFRTGWKRFYLKWYGENHPSAKKLCPKTLALLNKVPSVKAAMFASLPPGSKLVKHRDPYAGSLRYHLGLITPNSDQCSIFVDGESYYWRDGEDIMFDETYIHYAHNQTDHPRIILFCDIERPMRNKIAAWLNHFICKTLMYASAAPNAESDRTGFVNKAFKYLYAIRRVGKKLKAKNRKLYYLLNLQCLLC